MGGFWCVFTSTSSVFLSLDIQVASTSWALWIMLQWSWEYRCLFFPSPISIPLDKYPEVGLLEHTVFPSIFLRNLYTIFHKWLHHQQSTRVPFSPHLRQHLLFSRFFFFIMFILPGVDTSLWLWLPFPHDE